MALGDEDDAAGAPGAGGTDVTNVCDYKPDEKKLWQDLSVRRKFRESLGECTGIGSDWFVDDSIGKVSDEAMALLDVDQITGLAYLVDKLAGGFRINLDPGNKTPRHLRDINYPTKSDTPKGAVVEFLSGLPSVCATW